MGEQDVDEVVAEVNRVLHAGLGSDPPCRTACTHVVVGPWSALGIANVIGHRQRAENERG